MDGRIRHATRWLFQLVLITYGLGALTGSVQAADSAGALDVQSITIQINSKLREYALDFPEIHFIHLAGRHNIPFARSLTKFLGDGAKNVDYEHDASHRQTLLALQIERISLMLENGLPSATLFRTGTPTPSDHPYVCLITLDPVPFQSDLDYATKLVMTDSDIVLAESSDHPLLDNASFVQFILDHEAFHCIDAYLNGPSFRKTFDDLEADYQLLQAEIRADVYASFAYRTNHVETDPFLRNLAAFRTLSLLDMDLIHYTAPAIRSVLDSDPTSFTQADGMQRIRLSRDYAQALLPRGPFFANLISGAAKIQRSLREKTINKVREVPELTSPNPYLADVAQLRGEIADAITLIAEDSHSFH